MNQALFIAGATTLHILSVFVYYRATRLSPEFEMEILLIRHAIAEERTLFAHTGQPDAQRPLTEKGRSRMRSAINGLRRVMPQIDTLASSPLLRAVESAQLLAEGYGLETPLQLPLLAPGGDFDAIAAWLAGHDEASRVCLVGHEPDLSELIGWLTAGSGESFIHLKKSAVCLLRCDLLPEQGTCEIEWLLAPKQLRQLG
ncbi:phosphohistidine phosphatase SixA [endosymbiont of Riftia pachyptila (vent Ph05)]|nr:phosphohistidine phosphatase SixA [endosymbiont of Riftia pachyptila (vent Ph05)]